MSSSPTARTSTTSSSTSSASRAEAATAPADKSDRLALIACGAIAQPCAALVAENGWPVDVFPLPPLLHNSPTKIAGEVDRVADRLQGTYRAVAVGYSDCGTYGAVDELCERRGIARLPGLHCYDVFAGADRMRAVFDKQPGTYVLTDFLVRSFHRTVIVELGLDRFPELRDDYFGHYTRMVWLAQEPDDELRRLAAAAAEQIGLPLKTIETGRSGLGDALRGVLTASGF
jgi:hypothetical protein